MPFAYVIFAISLFVAVVEGRIMNQTISSTTNEILLRNIKTLVQKEREITLEVLNHLREISLRKFYLELGYGSLFEFAVNELGYSTGSAYLRIEAMRLLSELPEIESKVKAGEITLTNLALVQTTVKEQKKNGVTITSTEKKGWVEKVVHQSTREAERTLSRLVAEKTGVAQIKPVKTIHIEITEDLAEKIAILRAYSHKFSKATDEELFKVMVEVLHDQVKIKEARAVTSAPKVDIKTLAAEADIPSRYIPRKVRTRILLNSEHRCQFIDLKSKRRCENKRFLQIDHVKAYSKGGPSTEMNLQVLCSEHNAYKGAH